MIWCLCLSDLIIHHPLAASSFLLTVFLGSLNTKHIPTSGPLHLLFPLLGILSPPRESRCLPPSRLVVVAIETVVWSLSGVWLSVIPWTVAFQAPLSMGFPRQEHWSGLPFPSPGKSSWSRVWTQVSCIAGGFFTIWAMGLPYQCCWSTNQEKVCMFKK